MYEGHAELASTHSAVDSSEQRTLGGALVYLLAAPALIALIAAPAVAVGAVLGMVGLLFGERVVHSLRQRDKSERSLPAPESGSPA